jgi:UDP-N-acetylmuramoylalanine--D-glutamate ligase
VELAGRNVVLLGLGARTNVELARYLVARGADVTISDRKPADLLGLEIELLGDLPVRLVLGGHQESDVMSADLVFVSPGVPRDLPILSEARRRGIPLSSEIELLFDECRSPIVGITGSSGKTTTTTLVGLMLRDDGRRTYVGGNIGVPLINRLDEIGSDSWLVLELSSFQLEALGRGPRVGAILNVTPNHLDRHHTMEAYAEAKLNLLRYQSPTDCAVLGLDDPGAMTLAPRCPGLVSHFSAANRVDQGACVEDGEVILRRDNGAERICPTDEIKLLGRHNWLNVLAATAVAGAAGACAESIARVATSFTGVEHRLEPIRTLDGTTYYNDSIATTPERTCAALRSFSQPLVLIAGGRSKHLPLDEMANLVAQRCRALITIGEMSDEIGDAVRATGASLPIECASDLSDAARRARRQAHAGDAVLLSPSGTSFDAFRDFEERGHRFREAVLAL